MGDEEDDEEEKEDEEEDKEEEEKQEEGEGGRRRRLTKHQIEKRRTSQILVSVCFLLILPVTKYLYFFTSHL